MSKTLVIVESPAKSKTIGRYLGKDYELTASSGHVRDLPSSTMGVDVENNYKPRYISLKGKEKVIRELKEKAAACDRVLLATDPDREGEAIAWHVAQLLKIDEQSPCRISFNEITKTAVQNAVENPRAIDMDLVNSQQARRILDRLVGYELSPLLWKKVKTGLSAGRVQSVTTRMIVDREREIEAFKPEEYWLLTAFLQKTAQDPLFKARYHGEQSGEKIQKRKLTQQDQVDELIQSLQGQTYTVAKVKKSSRQRQPGPPFTTSMLQQEAARYLGFTSKKTMSIAQKLYEGIDMQDSGATALVTYIRTDSIRVSAEAEHEARRFIQSTYGDQYLPKFPRRFKNKNSAQDAHEAIRPVHYDLHPDRIKGQLSYDQHRLYKLIWDKFMASQMAAAQIDTVTADIAAGTHIFRAQGETVRFSGFLAQYGQQLVDQEADKEKEKENKPADKLPSLIENETLKLDRLMPEQKFTQPPARYTEATLVKAMEENGIGRPSTYAPTLSVIQDRLYVEKQQRFFHPTELGKLITVMLEENFAEIVDVAFTADLEKRLDTVESGEQDWVGLLDDFYPKFHKQIIEAGKNLERVKIPEVPIGEKCPDCQTGDLVIKEGRYGKFIACNGYPTCKYTRNLETTVKGKCPLCGSGLISRVSKKYRNSRFYLCDKQGSDPECPFISWNLPIEGKNCETCGSYMVWKNFRGRSYPGCGNRDCPTNKKKKASTKQTTKQENQDLTSEAADNDEKDV